MEIMDIINEDNEVTGQASRSEIISKKLLHRAIKVVVVNSNDEFLVCKRPEDKEFSPGKYEIGIGGGVQSGETFEDAMFRELKEELNLEAPPTFVKQFKYQDEKSQAIVHLYVLTYEEEININKDEVVAAEFVPIAKIEEMIDKDKMAPVSEYIFINSFEEVRELSK